MSSRSSGLRRGLASEAAPMKYLKQNSRLLLLWFLFLIVLLALWFFALGFFFSWFGVYLVVLLLSFGFWLSLGFWLLFRFHPLFSFRFLFAPRRSSSLFTFFFVGLLFLFGYLLAAFRRLVRFG